VALEKGSKSFDRVLVKGLGGSPRCLIRLMKRCSGSLLLVAAVFGRLRVVKSRQRARQFAKVPPVALYRRGVEVCERQPQSAFQERR